MSEAASLEAWPELHERYAASFGVDPEIGRKAYAEHLDVARYCVKPSTSSAASRGTSS